MVPVSDDRLEALVDRQAVVDLAVRYATALDTKDWTLLATCFVPDAVAIYSTRGRVEGYAGHRGRLPRRPRPAHGQPAPAGQPRRRARRRRRSGQLLLPGPARPDRDRGRRHLHRGRHLPRPGGAHAGGLEDRRAPAHGALDPGQRASPPSGPRLTPPGRPRLTPAARTARTNRKKRTAASPGCAKSCRSGRFPAHSDRTSRRSGAISDGRVCQPLLFRLRDERELGDRERS